MNWQDFKSAITAKALKIQGYETESYYELIAFDGPQKYKYSLYKNPTDTTDLDDFEANYKPNWNKKLDKEDLDTGGILFSPKFAPDGWHQQYFETEFESSSLNSIHEKDWNNVDLGYSSLKFYDSNDDEIVQGQATIEEWQIILDNTCTRTDLLWMPPFDYAIKSGFISQKSVPASNIYAWALGADLPAQYGGPQAVFAEGGMNLTYVDARYPSGLDGVAATRLNYSHPILGDGAGTNRLRFVFRHEAGFKHRIQIVLEIFLE